MLRSPRRSDASAERDALLREMPTDDAPGLDGPALDGAMFEIINERTLGILRL